MVRFSLVHGKFQNVQKSVLGVSMTLQIGRYSQLGNGYCDFPCNVESCGYDFGDCKPKEETPKPEIKDLEDSEYEALIPLTPTMSTVEDAPPKRFCHDSCGLQWLNDGVFSCIQSHK